MTHKFNLRICTLSLLLSIGVGLGVTSTAVNNMSGLDNLVNHFILPQNRIDGKKPRFKGTPADYGLEYKSMTLRTEDDLNLDSWYIRGNNSNGIILLHGNGGSKTHMLKHAKFLNHAGYSVLLFDFRAQGNSDGNYVTYGYYETRDVDAAINEFERIGVHRIGVLGTSLGGGVALLAAAKNKQIDAVVADCAYANVDLLAQNYARSKLDLPKFLSVPLVKFVEHRAERITGADYTQVNPENVVNQISPRPILFIHGERDTIVPFEQARRNYSKALEPKTLWQIPRGRHCSYVWNKSGVSGYESKVLNFFNSEL